MENNFKSNNLKLVSLIVGFFVVFLLWHSIDYHHKHPSFLGEGIQAVFHGEDKKFLHSVTHLGDFMLGNLIANLFYNISSLSISLIILATLNFFIFKLFDPVLTMLKRGSLQPKICH